MAIRAYLPNRDFILKKQKKSLKKQRASNQKSTREEVTTQALKIKNFKHQKSDWWKLENELIIAIKIIEVKKCS